MADVEIELTAHKGDQAPGDRVKLPAAEARRYVRSGTAVYATKQGAKDAGDRNGRTAAGAKAETQEG